MASVASFSFACTDRANTFLKYLISDVELQIASSVLRARFFSGIGNLDGDNTKLQNGSNSSAKDPVPFVYSRQHVFLPDVKWTLGRLLTAPDGADIKNQNKCAPGTYSI